MAGLVAYNAHEEIEKLRAKMETEQKERVETFAKFSEVIDAQIEFNNVAIESIDEGRNVLESLQKEFEAFKKKVLWFAIGCAVCFCMTGVYLYLIGR